MICSKCKKDLPEDNFPYRNKSTNHRRTECRECNRAFQQQIYNRNVEYINTWKAQGCRKCGDKRIYVIDAHHTDPSMKEQNICRFKVNASIEKLQAELDKCIPFCANCHREFHALGITLEEYLATEV